MLSILLLAATLPRFTDQSGNLGLKLGTDAACWIDYDQDGWTDLCASGVLWRNQGGKKFEKVFEPGLVVAGDFDNDGLPDLFSWSKLKLYHNDGKGGFSESDALPTLPDTVSRGACWGDFDGDGFLDLYVGGYENWDKGITYPSLLLMNQGGKSFVVKMTDQRYRARGVTAADFDRDGDLDIYVSDYRLQPNVLWVNQGKGDFQDRAADFGVIATSPGFDGGHSIGSAWGDFDADGELDLFAGNFAHVDSRGDQPKSRFLRNTGAAGGYKFEDKGTCGVFYQESYATPAAGDFDNDGRLDLFFTTVYATASFGKKNYPVLYRNESDFQFSDRTAECGLQELPATYQAAWADFDQDGDLDLVSGGKLFVNSGGGGNWVEVHLVGDGRQVNRLAIGAQVRIKVGERILTRQVEAGTGEGNQNDLVLHFGLGDRKLPVDLDVLWPGGYVQRVPRVRINHIVDVRFSRN